MAFYSPSFLLPNGTGIDPSQNNIFMWVTNAVLPDTQTDYQLFIYKNIDNSLIYNSNKITSSVSQHVVPSGTLTSGIDYKWKVTLWSGSTNVDSDWTLFHCTSSPSISMTVSDLSVQNYTFIANYSHPQSIPIQTYQFILYDNSGTNIITDSGLLYPDNLVTGGNVSYTVNGMVSGTTYKIICKVIDQNGMIVDTGLKTFTTTYTYPDNITQLIITPLNDIGAIKLNWEGIRQVLGIVDGTYSYQSGKFNLGLHLDSGSILAYNDTIPENFTLKFFVKIPYGYIGDIVTFGDDGIVGFDGKRFYYQYGDYITAGKYIDGLYPNNNIFPSNDLIPGDNNFLYEYYIMIGIKYNKLYIRISNLYTEIIT